MSWLKIMWRSALDIIGEPVRTPVDNGVQDTGRWRGTTSQKGTGMSIEAPSGEWVVTKVTLSTKELWATEMHLKGRGRAEGKRLTLAGMWLSKFQPPMFINQKVNLKTEGNYVVVKYLDYPILKSDNMAMESASG